MALRRRRHLLGILSTLRSLAEGIAARGIYLSNAAAFPSPPTARADVVVSPITAFKS